MINIYAGYISIVFLGLASILILGKTYIKKLSNLSILSTSFLLGASIINGIFTILMILGLPMTNLYISLLAVLSTIYLGYRLFTSNFRIKYDFHKIYKIILYPTNLFLLILSLILIVHNVNWPVTDWDALTLYDFRGKIFSEGLRVEAVKRDIHDSYSTFDYYYSYPFMTSTLHAWGYNLGASTPMMIYFGFYSSLVLLFIDKWGRKGDKFSLKNLFPVILACSSVLFSHATIAYSNLPYTVFFFCSIFFLLDEDHYSPFISTIMLTSSYLTRSLEPFWVITLALMLYTMAKRKKIFQAIFYSLIFLLFRHLWLNYAVVDLTNVRLNNISIYSILSKFNLKEFIQIEIFLFNNYITYIKIPSLLSILSLYILIKEKISLSLEWILVGLISGAILFGGGYIFAEKYTIWSSIGPSASRMMTPFIPLLLYFSFIYLSEYLDDKNY